MRRRVARHAHESPLMGAPARRRFDAVPGERGVDPGTRMRRLVFQPPSAPGYVVGRTRWETDHEHVRGFGRV